jgi:hypothetical protein
MRRGTSPPYCCLISASPCHYATSSVSSRSGWAWRHAQLSAARSAACTWWTHTATTPWLVGMGHTPFIATTTCRTCRTSSPMRRVSSPASRRPA